MHRSVAMLALAFGVASLAGCAHSGASSAATPTATTVQEAPEHAASAAPAGGVPTPVGDYTSPVRIVAGEATGTLFLRAAPGASGTSQLRVTIAHGGYWVNFDRAVDLAGQSYAVTQLDQNVSCNEGECVYYEDVAVALPEADLARAAHAGLVLRISGRKMTYVAQLPAAYVADFLDGLGEVAASRALKAAAAPVPAAPAP